MKSWGVILALGCALIGLVLYLRSPGEESAAARLARSGGSTGDTEGAGEGGSGLGRESGGRSAPGAMRPGAGRGELGSGLGGSGADRDGRPGSRQAQTASGGAQRGSGGVAGSGNRSGGSTHGGLSGGGLADSVPRARAPELTHREAPEQGAPGTHDGRDEFGDDPDAEEATDVAYDSGDDKVFDVNSKNEIKDAGPINSAAGTISFWLEPGWEANSQEGASFVQIGDGMEILKDGNQIRFQYTDATGMKHSGSADIADWKAGDWRNVIATWRGNQTALYVDGAQAFLNYAPGAPAFTDGATLSVGSSGLPNGAPMAGAELSYLTIMNHDATVDEVRQMFESGGRAQQ